MGSFAERLEELFDHFARKEFNLVMMDRIVDIGKMTDEELPFSTYITFVEVEVIMIKLLF